MSSLQNLKLSPVTIKGAAGAPFSELISTKFLDGVKLDFQKHKNSHTALYELVQSRSLCQLLFVYVCIVRGDWKHLNTQEKSWKYCCRLQNRIFFFLGHLNLFSLLHSEYVKFKYKSHCFLFAFSLFNFYSKVNTVCHSILQSSNLFFFFIFFLSLLLLFWPCRSLENFSVSTFSSHGGVLYITHRCGDSGLP